jgi:hypothetical protein
MNVRSLSPWIGAPRKIRGQGWLPGDLRGSAADIEAAQSLPQGVDRDGPDAVAQWRGLACRAQH